jgi:YVTN family beta-propeller protein
MIKKLPFALIVIAALGAALPGAVADTLLVANKSDHTVDLIDLASGVSRATLPTGRSPHEIAVSPDGSTAVIANYGDRSQPGASLTIIDVPGARVERTIGLGKHTRPHGLAFLSPDRVAVTTEGSAHLVIVDPSSGVLVDAVSTGERVSHMVSLVPQFKRAFVANIGSGTVTAIDLSTSKKLADITTGEGAEGIATTPDGREVWVGNRAADTLSIIDSETLTVKASLPCPGFPIRVAITPDGRHALVSAARSGEVVLFDVAERRELKRAQLDLSNAPDAARRLFGDRFGESPVPVGLVVSPAGDRAWVAATQADAVMVIDTRSLAVIGALKAGREPDGMAYSAVTLSAD